MLRKQGQNYYIDNAVYYSCEVEFVLVDGAFVFSVRLLVSKSLNEQYLLRPVYLYLEETLAWDYAHIIAQNIRC